MPFKQLERRDKIRFLRNTLRFVTFLPRFCKSILSTKFLQNRIGNWSNLDKFVAASLYLRVAWPLGRRILTFFVPWDGQTIFEECIFIFKYVLLWLLLFSEMKSICYWKWLKHMFRNEFLQGTSESRASSLKSPTKARW